MFRFKSPVAMFTCSTYMFRAFSSGTPAHRTFHPLGWASRLVFLHPLHYFIRMVYPMPLVHCPPFAELLLRLGDSYQIFIESPELQLLPLIPPNLLRLCESPS